MLIREECSCGAKVEAEDDDRPDCQRAVNTWRKLHACPVRISYYQSDHHVRFLDGLNGRTEAEKEEGEVPVS